MTFDQYRNEILTQSLICGTPADCTAMEDNYDQSNKLIAASALVIQDKGWQWAIDNPKAFRTAIFKYLGWAARIALVFTPASPWVVIARFLIPVIIEVLQRQYAVNQYGSATVDFDVMATHARRILKG